MKVLYITGQITILLGLVLLVYVYYLLFFPVKTIEYKNSPFKTTQSMYHAGDTVKFPVTYCRYFSGQSHVIAGLADDTTTTLGVHDAISITGCHSIVSSMWKIPPGTYSGKYHLVFYMQFQVNPLRAITVESETTEFTVQN